MTDSPELDAVKAYEGSRIARRRALYGIPTVGNDPAGAAGPMIDDDTIALALSGGGIRSATFSLGVMRELSRLGLFQRIDYLSTVSGGSYVGSFIGGLYARRGGFDGLLSGATDEMHAGGTSWDPLGSVKVRNALDWLRQSGRYLAPSGGADLWYAFTILTRNWFGVQLVIGAALFLLALFGIAVRLLLASPWPDRIASCPLLARLWPVHAGWVSPIFLFAAIPEFVAVALGWAYWLTRREASRKSSLPVPALAGSAIAIAVCAYIGWCSKTPSIGGQALAVLGTMSVAIWAAATWTRLRVAIDSDLFRLARAWDLVRQDLTQLQARIGSWGLVLAGIAVLDSVAFVLWQIAANGDWSFKWLSLPPLLTAVLVPVAHWLTKHAPKVETGKLIDRLKALGVNTLTAIVATVLTVLIVVSWAVAAYAVCHWLLGGGVNATTIGWRGFAWLFGATLGFNIAIGYAASFLNLSSLSTFYAGRLRRAYLGASNTARVPRADTIHATANRMGVDVGDDDDEIRVGDYFGADAAPLHLINITLNETQSAGSNLVQRDRHGRNLLLSPAGLLYTRGAGDTLRRVSLIEPRAPVPGDPGTGPDEAAALAWLEADFPGDDPGEPLPMSAWVAISGAAFSTGLGQQTSFGMAMLAGLANIRLGYWWNRVRTAPWERIQMGTGAQLGRWRQKLFGGPAPAQVTLPPAMSPAQVLENRTWWPIQFYLLSELRGSFTGAERQRWYLTDGGHFDNSAVYELIRRQARFIIACDNGADATFRFDDVANIVRKARIDFGADVHFLDDAALDKRFRTSKLLRRAFRGQAKLGVPAGDDDHAVAMLATVTYADGSTATMVVLKPRLTGDGPADLRHYHAANPDFPQQTTLDQFFDEAQWESYHILGQLVTRAVFGQTGGSWNPRDLQPL
jgi:predicted acylesterase/phospholipase RssA